MFFKARSDILDDAALADLRVCADAAPDGIAFLIKRDGEPCRPISASELDALDISYGA